MKTAQDYSRAIKAGLAYTGQTRDELAMKMDIHPCTLGRKLRNPETLTVADLIAAEKAIHWSAFMEVLR